MATLISWIGSKRLIAAQVIEQLEPIGEVFVEAFAGSAAVTQRLRSDAHIALADADAALIRMYQGVRDDPGGVIAALEGPDGYRRTVGTFERARAVITAPGSISDATYAAAWITVNKLCFGGRMRNPTCAGWRQDRMPASLETVTEGVRRLSKRLQGAQLHNWSWQATMARYDAPEATIYLDPPYPQMTGYGAGGKWSWTDIGEVMDAMQRSRARCVMSISGSDMARQMARERGMPTADIPHRYILCKSASGRPQVVELIVKNYRYRNDPKRWSRLALTLPATG